MGATECTHFTPINLKTMKTVTKNTSVAASQILEASVLGTLAFKYGLKRAPFYDTQLNKFFAGRNVGETPKGEASSIAIMKAWTDAWDNANLSN